MHNLHIQTGTSTLFSQQHTHRIARIGNAEIGQIAVSKHGASVALDNQARQLMNAINPQHQLCQQGSRGKESSTAFVSKLLCRVGNRLGNAHLFSRKAGIARPAYKMTSHLSLRENGQIIIRRIVGIFLP